MSSGRPEGFRLDGALMRQAREAHGWSQVTAARAAGISRSHWVGVEHGRRRASAGIRAAIARVCEATPEQITVADPGPAH